MAFLLQLVFNVLVMETNKPSYPAIPRRTFAIGMGWAASLFALGAWGCTDGKSDGTPSSNGEADSEGSPEEELDKQVKQAMRRMSMEQKVAQLFFVPPESITFVKTVVAASEATLEALQHYPVGGFLYSAANFTSSDQAATMTTNAFLHGYNVNGLPLMLAVNEEGGYLNTVADNDALGAIAQPSAREVGNDGDTQKAGDRAHSIANYLSAIGLNTNIGLVCDMCSEYAPVESSPAEDAEEAASEENAEAVDATEVESETAPETGAGTEAEAEVEPEAGTETSAEAETESEAATDQPASDAGAERTDASEPEADSSPEKKPDAETGQDNKTSDRKSVTSEEAESDEDQTIYDKLDISPGELMSSRSFSNDPAVVSAMVSAEIESYTKSSVMTIVKHFPGIACPQDGSVMYSLATDAALRDKNMLPFTAAIDAGVPAIMVSNASIPCVAGETPACLSASIVTDLLRDELGFEGIIMTDRLDNDIMSTHKGAAVDALRAGCDMIFCPADFESSYNQVLDAVAHGPLDEERINESVRRIIRIKLQSLPLSIKQ
jgi:beta-N-acetylhexosaminidase